MDRFNIVKSGTELQILGLRDAVKLLSIENHSQAQRLADLGLHRVDLEFAYGSLEELKKIPIEAIIIRQALWRGAIIHFIKCFGDNKRFQLDIHEIINGEPDGIEVFEYFFKLRNKHIVHDVNAYAQCLTGAALNAGDKEYKIEKIISLTMVGETCEPANYDNLKLLIGRTLLWVNAEFDKICNSISRDLEKETYEVLNSRKTVQYRVPKVDEIGTKRAATSKISSGDSISNSAK